MINKPKRKNNEFAVTRYDRGWRYAVCRWMRWTSETQIAVAASPETCMMHLRQITDAESKTDATRYFHTSHIEVFPLQGGNEYEFQATMGIELRGGYIESVIGLIVDDGDGQSLVTLRTYNKTPFVHVGLVLTFILFTLINPNALTLVACFFFLLLSIPVLLLFSFMQPGSPATDRIIDHLKKAPRLLAPGQTDLTPKRTRRIRHNQRKS